MAAIWGRAWRSMASSTAHEVGDDGGLLQPTAGGERGSTTSGTNYSTTTTHTTISERSLASHPFTVLPTAPAVEENADELGEEERVKKLEHIKSLVVLFRQDNNSAPERWLSELGVIWVLHLAHVNESGRSFISGQLKYLAGSWIEALFEITKYISVYFGGHLGKEKATDDVGNDFLRFVQATLFKMLPFVDAIVAVRISGRKGAGEPADEKLQALILVREALSMAPAQILPSFSSSPSCQDYLSADLLAKLDEAIWDTMEETMFSSYSRGTQRSPNIHKGTLSVINCINVLWANYGSVNRILHDAFLRGEFLPENENVSHLINLTIQTAHSLEEMVTRNSQSFPNQSLKLLFLINNFYFILQHLHTHCPLVFPIREHLGKIDDYIHSYIQVSWAPVSECLRNLTPRCFMRRSLLPRFESKFQQTYMGQRLWKVPAPEMRKRLRNAIVEEVIPIFTQFLKDNSNSTPRVAPQEMTKLLNGLFEG